MTSRKLSRLFTDSAGLSSIEYALLVEVIGIVTLAALDIIGDEVLNTYLSVTSDIDAAVP